MSLRQLVGVAVLMCAGNAVAQEVPRIKWETGLEYYQETYRETINGAPFMQEEADMVALSAKAHIPFNARHAAVVSARYATGSSRYTGAYMGQPYGSLMIGDLDRYSAEVKAAYELTLPYVTPSLGVGYRRLIDRLDQGGSGGYERTSQYWFVTAGLASTIDLGQSGLQLTPKIEYHHLLRGKQHSADIVNHQRTGYGAELSLALSGKLSPTVGLHLTPYYRYWHIDDSELAFPAPGVWFMEPQNTTREVGVRLSLTF